MTTKLINLAEARTRLSHEIDALQAGDRILLCRRNRPVAEVRPLLDQQQNGAMKLGVAVGQMKIPASFPETDAETIEAFEGTGA